MAIKGDEELIEVFITFLKGRKAYNNFKYATGSHNKAELIKFIKHELRPDYSTIKRIIDSAMVWDEQREPASYWSAIHSAWRNDYDFHKRKHTLKYKSIW